MPKKRKSVDTAINCIIPQSLSEGSILRDLINTVSEKPLTHVQYWTYLRFLDLIASKQDLIHNEGYVQLNAETMAKNLGSRYKDVINDLIKLNIIEVKKNARGTAIYARDTHESKKYRLTDTFIGDSLTLVKANRRVFKNKPKKDIVDTNTQHLLADINGFPEYNFLKGWLHKLRFDLDGVVADCDHWLATGAHVKGEPFPEVRRELFIRASEALNDDEIKFTIKLSGKIYADLTPSPKALRHRLTLDGYSGTLMHSDVSSTHLLLALPDMRGYKTHLTKPEEIAELDLIEQMIASTTFYKTLSEQIRAEGVIVTDDKEDFLRRFCNSPLNHPNKYKTALNKLYPTFTKFLNTFKKGKSFTAIMNPVEAHLFNNRIAHRVVKELGSQTFLAGIFDALIYREEDSEPIRAIIDEEVYRATGLMNMVKHTTLRAEAEKVVSYPLKAQKEIKQPPLTVTTIIKSNPIIMTINNTTSNTSRNISEYREYTPQEREKITRDGLAYMEAIRPSIEAELKAAHDKWYEQQQVLKKMA